MWHNYNINKVHCSFISHAKKNKNADSLFFEKI